MRFNLLLAYYQINRSTWPEMSPRAAWIDAWKLWRKTRKIKD